MLLLLCPLTFNAILLFMANFVHLAMQSVESERNRHGRSHEVIKDQTGEGWSTPWPTRRLDETVEQYTDVAALKEWYCATESTRFPSSAQGRVTITEKGIEIEMLGWLLATGQAASIVMPLQFLVLKDLDKFTEYRIIERQPSSRAPAALCARSDFPQAFKSDNSGFVQNIPYCEKFPGEQEIAPNTYKFKFLCRAFDETSSFWQPKPLPDAMAASSKYAIYAVAAGPDLGDPNCLVGNSVKYFYPSTKDNMYRLLVHKDDVEGVNGLEDCLNRVESTTPMATTEQETSTEESTTSTTTTQTTTATNTTAATPDTTAQPTVSTIIAPSEQGGGNGAATIQPWTFPQGFSQIACFMCDEEK